MDRTSKETYDTPVTAATQSTETTYVSTRLATALLSSPTTLDLKAGTQADDHANLLTTRSVSTP